MTLVLVTPPSVEPLTAAEAKAMLNIGDEVSDTVMAAFIKAARQMIDGAGGWVGRACITQTWDLFLDHFEGYQANWPDWPDKGFYPRSRYYSDRHRAHPGIMIPLPPLQSVTSVKYLDSDGVEQTVDPATYTVQQGEPAHIALATGQSWPSPSTLPGSVIIRFVAGYGNAGSAVDERLRMAIALQAGHMRSLMQQSLFLNREEIPGVISQGWTVGQGASLAINDASAALLSNLRVWT